LNGERGNNTAPLSNYFIMIENIQFAAAIYLTVLENPFAFALYYKK
jgi:hypothetical protein